MRKYRKEEEDDHAFLLSMFLSSLPWNKQQIPVAHVQLCHLLDYEHQLLSIVLSHCRYSLTYGHGQDISYDLPALQKHIVDRFIHGKPHLVLDIPQVIYRRDVYTATSFANIRKKVSPQVCSCVWVIHCVARVVTDQIESERAAGYHSRPAIGAEDTRLS